MLRLIPMLFALALGACTSTQGGQFCQVAKPIYATPADAAVISDRLVRDLNKHNAVGAALCKWKP